MLTGQERFIPGFKMHQHIGNLRPQREQGLLHGCGHAVALFNAYGAVHHDMQVYLHPGA